MKVKNAKRHRESIYELPMLIYIPFTIPSIISFMICHMVYEWYGIWNMKNPKNSSISLYLHVHLFTEPYHSSFRQPVRKWKKYELRRIVERLQVLNHFVCKQKINMCWTLYHIHNWKTIDTSTAPQHIIFSIFLYFSSKSNLCTVQIVGFFDGNNSDKVTSCMKRSTKSASTLCKCLLLNIWIWTADWDKRVCFIYMHSFRRINWNENTQCFVSLSSGTAWCDKNGEKNTLPVNCWYWS